MTQDDRTFEDIQRTIGLVVATDRFMSGWGKAPRRSLVACPVVDDEDRERVERRFQLRSEFKRVRFVYGALYTPRLHQGDHLHVYGMNSFRYAL